MSQSQNKNAVVYYRVSTTEQAERGFSLESQKELCLEYAKKNGLEVVKLFSDAGESAKTADRRGLQELIKFCSDKRNKVDAVIVYKIDRLSRNVTDYAQISSLLQGLSITLLSVTEALGENSFGKFMGNIMASIAQLDNDVRSERVKEGMRKCYSSGRTPHKVKLGYINYTRTDGTKEIVWDPERADIVLSALVDFSTGLYLREELQARLNKQGLRTREGKEISCQLLHTMLTSKFYFGVLESPVYGEAQGTHQPLIDEATYWKNQKILGRPTKGDYISQAAAKEDFPLRHFCLCSHCGRYITASLSTNKVGKRYAYYHCYNSKCPSRIYIAKEKLEDTFSKYLENITPRQALLDAFKEVILDRWKQRYAELGSMSRRIAIELDKLHDERQSLLDLVKKKLLPEEDFKLEFEKVKQQIMDKQLELKEQRLEELDLDKAVSFVFDFVDTIPEFWAQASYAQRVKLQCLIFPEKVTYDKQEFRTPKMSHIFQSKTTLVGGFDGLVDLGRIELPPAGCKPAALPLC